MRNTNDDLWNKTNFLLDKAEAIEEKLAPFFKGVEKTAFYNQRKVLAAFRKNMVSDFHLTGSTGYGYDDSGRDVLEQVYADVFGAEALPRAQPDYFRNTCDINQSIWHSPSR